MKPEDVILIIQRIAELVSPTAKEVWAIYYRQTMIAAIEELFWGVVLIVGSGTGIKILAKRIRAVCAKNEPWSDPIGEWIAVIVLVIFIAIGCGILTQGVQDFANPAYGTIWRLLRIGK